MKPTMPPPQSPAIQLDTSNQGLVQQSSNLTGGQKFREALSGITSALAGAAGAAAPYIPGGSIVSAALSGLSDTAHAAIANGGGVGPFGGMGGFGSSVSGGGSGFGGGSGGLPSIGGSGGGGLPSIGGGGGYGGSGLPSMGTGGSVGGSGATPTTPAGQMQSMAKQNMYFLQLQQQAEHTNEVFSTLSNLMSVRHQTNQTAIQNIK